MAIPQVVASILRSGAPTLLSAIALPPPFNLIASAVVSGVLAKYLPPDVTPTQSQPDGTPVLSPTQVQRVVEANANDPNFLQQLREAERRLQEYEANNNIKFAELEVQDRTRAGQFQTATGTARPLLYWGMGIVVVSITAMALVVIASVLLVSGQIKISNPDMAVGVFGLIGAVVGYISGYGGQIIGFYYGSSQGSKDKTESLTATLHEQGERLGQAVVSAATAATTATAATADAIAKAVPPPPPRDVQPSTPTAPAAPVKWRQGRFGGRRWQLTENGILDEGESVPERTTGEPATVRRIWRDFGDIIRSACEEHRVPMEVVVTTIAVESGGRIKASLTEPDGRTSVGLMQTLTGTASQVMGRPVTGRELEDPKVSIEVGVRYIASQREMTMYDPILVAAAYNAGGLYPPREQDDNPYRLRSTKDHLTRTKLYYNDTVAVAKADGWFKQA